MRKHLSLSEIQSRFSKIVMSQELDFETHAELFRSESGTPVPLETRLDIYHYAYFARILESLAEDFSELRALVGEAVFEDLIRAYLARYPSRYFGLAQIGQNFSRFLAEIHPEHPEWEALAQLEWAKCLASWSEGSEPTHFGKLLELSPDEQLRQILVLSPSLQIAKTCHGSTAVFKVRGQIQNQEFTPSMEELISEIQAGKNLGELIELFESNAELSSSGMSWISNWVSLGIIVSFRSI